MTKEENIQVKVRVGLEPLWNALSKDVCSVVPRVLPDRVSSVELIEGDGGLGTILLFKFHSRESKELFDATSGRHQLEKIVDFDESLHQIGLAVLEGGYLDVGYSSYKTVFQLTAIGESETLVDVKVVYRIENDEPKEMNLNPTRTYLKSLEDYILNVERLEKEKKQNELRNSEAMKKEVKTQVEVEVGIEALWKALAKDLSSAILKTMSEFVSSVEIIEGDGGSGTLFLFKFGSGATNLGYQKEKLVDLDETDHQLGLEVVEGGQLSAGFSYYKTLFKLTAKEESKTLVNIKVVYVCKGEQVTGGQEKTLKASETFIKRLGCYLLNEVK